MLKYLIVSIRPKQWYKNSLLFAPLFFSENLLDLSLFGTTLIAFICFCLLSSGVYIINDIIDLEADTNHPRKKKRPITSGFLSIRKATTIAIVLLFLGIFFSFILQPAFGLIAILYLGIGLLYILKLKDILIIDALCIAGGLILRVAGGVMVIELSIYEANWLFACAGLLALLLVFSKRRSELLNLGNNATIHRKVLSKYKTHYLDKMMLVTAIAIFVVYVFYIFSAKAMDKFGGELLITIPFVFYGLFRYLFLINQGASSREDPIDILLLDKPLLTTFLLWLISATVIIYSR